MAKAPIKRATKPKAANDASTTEKTPRKRTLKPKDGEVAVGEVKAPRKRAAKPAAANDTASAQKAPRKRATKPKETKTPAPEEKAPSKRAGKPKTPKAAAEPAPSRALHEMTHNGMTLRYHDDVELERLTSILPILDAAVAIGRILITGAVISDQTVQIHADNKNSPTNYANYPGVFLTLDLGENVLTFDHITVGFASAERLEGAAFETIAAIFTPHSDNGRHEDWMERAAEAIDRLTPSKLAA